MKKSGGPIPKRQLLMSSSSSEDDNDECEKSRNSPFCSSESSKGDKSKNEVNEPDFVVVKFPKKKTLVHYVGNVVRVMQPAIQYEIKFLRRRGTAFIYPQKEDKAVVAFKDICQKVPLLSVRRGQHYFEAK